MKSRLFRPVPTTLLLLAALTCGPALTAETAPATAAPVPAAPAASDPTAEFKVLFEQITTKLKAGQQSEADFTAELKRFGEIIARCDQDQVEEAAMISLMRARLYLEVFDNAEKALALLRQIKADYPTSKVAGSLDKIIGSIEAKQTADANFAIGKTFPTFAEQDLEGKPLSPAAFKGKVVLIDFWATWCGPCVAELPNVIAAYAKYHAQGFEIIGISLDKNRETLVAFLKEHQMTWAQYFDGLGWQNKVSTQYGIESIPATFLLDGEGRIVARDLRGDALDKQLASLLAK